MRGRFIKGFPVVDLDDGTMVGRVQDLIVDPAGKKVRGLQVGEKGFLKGKAQLIPFTMVQNVGSDVLTVRSKGEPVDEDEQMPLESLREYLFLGNSVISSEGNYIARVQDFTFSTTTGAIESLLLYDVKGKEKTGRDVFLGMEGVVNLGRDYIIAESNYTSYLTEKEREKPSAKERREPGAEALQQEEDEGKPGPDSSAEEGKEEKQQQKGADVFEQAREVWTRLEKELARGGKELAQDSKEKMKQYMLGKKANYTVKDNQGHPLVQRGAEITEEVIVIAEAQEKITPLFFSAVSEEIEESLNSISKKISGIFRSN